MLFINPLLSVPSASFLCQGTALPCFLLSVVPERHGQEEYKKNTIAHEQRETKFSSFYAKDSGGTIEKKAFQS